MPYYPWFEEAKNEVLEQGDILENFIIPTPRREDPTEIELSEWDLIIMTQSCDLMNDKISHVICCPVFDLEYYSEEIDPNMKKKDVRNKIIKGMHFHMHMINKCEMDGLKRDFRLVNLARVIEIQKESIVEFVEKNSPRLRLMPPYREHLAQAFARSFMRVGLPEDIPRF